MENKDLKEMLKSMENILELLNNSDLGKAKEKFSNMLEEAINQPCKISINKSDNGKCEMGVEGQRLAILVTLAGAEKGILKQVHCSHEEFDFIKNFVGTKDADDVEVL